MNTTSVGQVDRFEQIQKLLTGEGEQGHFFFGREKSPSWPKLRRHFGGQLDDAFLADRGCVTGDKGKRARQGKYLRTNYQPRVS